MLLRNKTVFSSVNVNATLCGQTGIHAEDQWDERGTSFVDWVIRTYRYFFSTKPDAKSDFNNYPAPARPSGERAQELWDPYAPTPVSRPEALEGITAAVHLSGANLAARRWTSAYKSEIAESRVRPTHALASLLAGLRSKPEVLVCASAIGIYGNRGDEELSEASLPGSGFHARLMPSPGKRQPGRQRTLGSA